MIARAIVLANDGCSASAICSMNINTPNVEILLEDALIDELRKNGANNILEKLGINIRI